MIVDEQQASSINTSTELAGSIMTNVSSGNFVISLVMKGSMQQLWGTIRAVQMIVLIALVKVNLPINTFIFFQGCVVIADMDVMDGQTFFEDNFEFYPTPPLNDNFEFFKLTDMNFMN